MIDVSAMTVARAAAAFRAGRFSPRDLAETYLKRVRELDGALNSYLTVTSDAALSAAERAAEELARGIDRGPLHGIPVAYKDLFDTAGVRTTAASRIYAHRVPDRDAEVVRALSNAGVVPMGKLNMLEFAYGVVHPDYGPARNPWNLERSSGGSSSGSAVAVAAGLCLAALGSDTGGSIRMPAAWCGVVGFKPTYDLVSRAGVVPLSWSLDHVGPLTRTAYDAALMLEAMAERPDGIRDRGRGFQAAALDDVDVPHLRIGVPRQLLDTGVDDAVRRVVEDALSDLAECGMAVEDVSLGDADDILAAELTILFAEASAFHIRWLRERAEDYAPLTRDRLEAGIAIPAVHYINALRAREAIVGAFRDVFRNVDLVALPSAPTTAIRLDETSLSINGAPVDIFRGLIRITGPFNLTGTPAISVPCGCAPDGLPVGLQLAGPWHADHVVLAAARAFEERRAAPLRLPPLGEHLRR